jgi:hypothetical protein
MVRAKTKESIDLTNGVQITVQTAYRRIRGRKVLAAICDEIGFRDLGRTSRASRYEGDDLGAKSWRLPPILLAFVWSTAFGIPVGMSLV